MIKGAAASATTLPTGMVLLPLVCLPFRHHEIWRMTHYESNLPIQLHPFSIEFPHYLLLISSFSRLLVEDSQDQKLNSAEVQEDPDIAIQSAPWRVYPSLSPY